MQGDFSRDTYNRQRHYSSVRHQQGRVQLEADFNEQADINNYLERTANLDEIGPNGAPYTAPTEFRHFKLAGASLANLVVAPGRFYLEGLLLENDAPAQGVALNAQPHLPADAPIVNIPDNDGADHWVTLADAPADGRYLAYLQVAERHVTALEDENLREVALNGPDTTTRVQTTWQVRLLKIAAANDGGPAGCGPAAALLPKPGRGRLTISQKPPAPQTDPCEPGGGGGYTGLENHFYRMQIFKGGALGAATWVWSRENGSVVVAVENFIAEPAPSTQYFKVEVNSLGRDDILGMAQDNWVELLDDRSEQLGQPGTLAQIKDIKSTIDGGYILLLSEDVANFKPSGNDPKLFHPRLRRWDQSKGLQPDCSLLTSAGPVELENGIQASFSVEAGSGPEFEPGAYWYVAARALTGEVEILSQAAPRGAKRYALLSLLDFTANNPPEIIDCRPQFVPAVEMVNLLYVGGDGQQGEAGKALPAGLQVSVTRGQLPVPGAKVCFTPQGNSGTVSASPAETGPDGVARVTWTLSSDTGLQVVEACLLLPDGSDAPNPPVRFNALLAPKQVGGGNCCCLTVGPEGDFKNLTDALVEALKAGENGEVSRACVCLMPGEHVLDGFDYESPNPKVNIHVHIRGCGPASRVILTSMLTLRRLASFTLEDLAIESPFVAETGDGALGLHECGEVTLRGVSFSGIVAPDTDLAASGALIRISPTPRVLLRDLYLEARQPDTFPLYVDLLFQTVDISVFANALQAAQDSYFTFQREALAAGENLVGMAPADRERLTSGMKALGADRKFSSTERAAFIRMQAALLDPKTRVETFALLLDDLRRGAILNRPGTALVLGSLDIMKAGDKQLPLLHRAGSASLESSVVLGVVSLYGLPATLAGYVKLLTQDPAKIKQIVMEPGTFHQGTLELRGNQIARMGLPLFVLDALANKKNLDALGAYFDELLLTDNISMLEPVLTAAQHVGLSGNQFLACPVQPLSAFFGRSGVFTGNRGEPGARSIFKVVAQEALAANLPAALFV
jgi:hypothetical protein